MRPIATFLLSVPTLCAALAGGDERAAVFIENKGQWNGPFVYQASAGPLAMFLEPEGVTYSLLSANYAEVLHDALHDRTAPLLSGHAWRVQFVGAAPTGTQPFGPSAKTANYILGNNPARWKSHVRSYAEIVQANVWPGVDVRHYRVDEGFKYDVELAPGADETLVRLRYEGLDGLSINDRGDLVLTTSVGELIERAPVAWYADAPSETVLCSYSLSGVEVGFVLRGADRSRAIVIDPVLIGSTLSGTVGTQNYGHTATYDFLGNIYTGGRSFGQGYPTSLGAFQDQFAGGGVDMAFSKYNGDASDQIWSTYVGGNGTDLPHSMWADDAGTLYAMGSTWSADFPTTANAYDVTFGGGTAADIAVLRIQDDGTALIGSTFMGGPEDDGSSTIVENYGDAYRGEIIIDGSGNCLVVGASSSPSFPVTAGVMQATHGGGQDGVLFSLNNDMSQLNWSTFLGGAADDMAYGLRLESNGNVYVTGAWGAADLPATVGAYQTSYQGGAGDGYILHLAPGATSVLHGTYFGTSELDQLMFIDLQGSGDVHVYGQTDGLLAIQPVGTLGNAGADICLAKFDPQLSTAAYTTVVGENLGFGHSLVPDAFMVDVCGHPCISGYMPADSLPLTIDSLAGTGGFYLAVYEPDMSGLMYATYFSGHHVDAGTSHFDPNGIIYQAVCTPGPYTTTIGAWSNTQPQGWDIGVFKIDLEQAGAQAYVINPPVIVCNEQPTAFNASGNAQVWEWDFGAGGGALFGQNVNYTYNQTGAYTVKLKGMDAATCNVVDSMQWTLQVDICSGIDEPTHAQQLSAWCDDNGYVVLGLPEPAHDATVVDLYDTEGRLTRSATLAAGARQVRIASHGLASGVYAVRTNDGSGRYARVFVQ